MKVSEEVGPVLKAEPKAALTLATAAAAVRAERVWREKDILCFVFGAWSLDFGSIQQIGPTQLVLPGSK